jgi:hypothetical protein
MSQSEDPSDRAEGPEQLAERGEEIEGSETVSLLDAEVEAPINAAVHPDFDERKGLKGDSNGEDEDPAEDDVQGDDVEGVQDADP